MADPSIPDRVRDLLRGRRARVGSADIVTELELELELDDEELFWELEDDDTDLRWWADESWSHVPTLLDGVVTVHRMTADEVGSEWITDGPDTAALLAWNPAPVVDGERLDLELRPTAHWPLPTGLVDGASEGDLFVARHGMDGVVLEIVPANSLDLAPHPDDVLDRLRRKVTALRDDGDVDLTELVLSLTLDWPEFLTVPRVLSEVLEAAELPVVGDYVLAPGEDPAAWQLERRRNGLDPYGEWPEEAVDATVAVIDAEVTVARGGELDLPTARGVAAALADEDAFELFVQRELAGWLDSTERLQALVEHVDDVLDGDVGAGVHTLRSRLADRDGDLSTQQAANAAAREADPGFAPALLDHACDLEDAGEVQRAAAVLRGVGVRHDDGQYQRLQWLLEPAYPDVGRNEPCPCGSGRKHKKCHMDGGVADEDRPYWLFARMIEWVHRPAMRPLARELSMTYVDRFDDPLDALRYPVGAGIALFDAGAARRYLASRSGLLPDVDRRMLERWVDEVRFDALHALELADDRAVVRSVVDGREFEVVGEVLGQWSVWGDIMVGAHVVSRPDGRLTALSLCPAPPPVDDLPDVIAEGDHVGLAAWYEGNLMLAELADRQR